MIKGASNAQLHHSGIVFFNATGQLGCPFGATVIHMYVPAVKRRPAARKASAAGASLIAQRLRAETETENSGMRPSA